VTAVSGRVPTVRMPTLSRPGRSLYVALVGADGAGKSTVSDMLERADLPFPVKRIYMGVNLDSSTLMLPTTRLLLARKRARGGRPDLVATTDRAERPVVASRGVLQSLRHGSRELAKLGVWMLEEWLRQLVAAYYGRRGYVVVFDRHFYADYYDAHIASRTSGRPRSSAVHGWTLEHLYPKPDLVICLDAPADVLFARKPEASVEWLEQRRLQYLRLEGAVPALAVVDVDRPLEDVFAAVVSNIRHQWEVRSA
jgi:thymidylate kinase